MRFVGDTMLDLFMKAASELDDRRRVDLSDFGVAAKTFYLATVHRAENTDDTGRLLRLMEALDALDRPVVLPAHPRTRSVLDRIGWKARGALRLFDPVGYFDILYLAHNARATITDSGGLSKESFFAGVPVIVPLPNSGWREIVEQGWAKVIPERFETFPAALGDFENLETRSLKEFGDGRSGEKIVEAIKAFHCDVSRVPWHVAGPFDAVAPVPSTRSWREDQLATAEVPTVLLVRALPDEGVERLRSLIAANSALELVLCVGEGTLNPLSLEVLRMLDAATGRARVLCEPGFVPAMSGLLEGSGRGTVPVEGKLGAGLPWTEVAAAALIGDTDHIEAVRVSPSGRGRLEAIERQIARVHDQAANALKEKEMHP